MKLYPVQKGDMVTYVSDLIATVYNTFDNEFLGEVLIVNTLSGYCSIVFKAETKHAGEHVFFREVHKDDLKVRTPTKDPEWFI